MSRVRVLVTITSEAVVDVPADATNVDEFLREQVSLAWGEARIERLVHEDVSVAFYPVDTLADEAAETAATEETTEEPVEETSAETALELVEEVQSEALAAEEASEPVEPVATDEQIEQALLLVEASTVEPVAAPVPEPAATVEEAPSDAPPVLTRDAVLSLFSDPLYKDMIRSAVQARAVAMLEEVVAEVISELEPLIRRQAERRRSSGA